MACGDWGVEESTLNSTSRFPKDLDVAVKATLIGAALLIDFAFFER